MYNLGILFLFLFGFLSSAKNVFVGSLLQKLDPFFVLAVSFGLVTIFFLLLSQIKGLTSKTIQSIKENPKEAFLLCTSSFGGWITFYYALKFIEPAIVTGITSAVCPIITRYFFSNKNDHQKNIYWVIDGILSWSIFIITAYLVFKTFQGQSSMGKIPDSNAIIGFSCAFACGLANTVTTVFSKKFNDKGLKPMQILSFRFAALVIISTIIYSAKYSFAFPSTNNIIATLAVAFFGILIPSLFFQEGIARTSPMIAAYNWSIIPIFVLAMEFFDSNRLKVTTYSVSGIISISILSAIAIWLQNSSSNFLKPRTDTDKN